MPPSPYAVTTLFEGHYHYGAGALVNSLYRHGYRGTIWAGLRGPLPPWARAAVETPEGHRFRVAEGCDVLFVPLATDTHFTHYKADFLLHVLDADPALAGAFYFDPDIVVRGRWGFFEEWVGEGIALCEDVTYPAMPNSHPFRAAWRRVMTACALDEVRPLDRYYNAGFIGVPRGDRAFLDTWRTLLHRLEADGVDLAFLRDRDRSHAFYVPDQDMMNAALMATTFPVSALGPEGMGFTPGGFTMSHAIDEPKPWVKHLFWRTRWAGTPPGLVDKHFLQAVDGPIRLYGPVRYGVKWGAFWLGRAVGSLLHRH